MSISTTIVELEFTNIVTNVPFVVGIQTRGIVSDVYLKYGALNLMAAQGPDYSVIIAPDLLTFSVTPYQPLLDKIADNGPNVVHVGRAQPLTSDFDNDDAFVRDKIVHEFDRVWMASQEDRFLITNLLQYADDTQSAVESAAAAANSAAEAAASAVDAANQVALAAAAGAAQVDLAEAQVDLAEDQVALAAAQVALAAAEVTEAAAEADAAAASATAAAASAASAVTLRSFRNRIINGNFAIAQRGVGPILTPVLAMTYTLDRWYFVTSEPGRVNVSQSPDVHLDRMAISVNATAALGAADAYYLGQKIEGHFIRDMGWGNALAVPAIISFEIFSSLTGTFGIAIRNASGGRSWVGSFTINAINTFEKKTITVPGDITGTWETGNLCGIDVTIAMGVGSNWYGTAGWNAANRLAPAGMTNFMSSTSNIWYLRQFQLERDLASEFERVPYDIQLQRCMRYYQKYGATVLGYGGAGVVEQIPIPFSVRMRAGPTATKVGAAWIAINCSQPVINMNGVDGYNHCTTVTALGQFQSYPSGGTDTMTFAAEL